MNLEQPSFSHQKGTYDRLRPVDFTVEQSSKGLRPVDCEIEQSLLCVSDSEMGVFTWVHPFVSFFIVSKPSRTFTSFLKNLTGGNIYFQKVISKCIFECDFRDWLILIFIAVTCYMLHIGLSAIIESYRQMFSRFAISISSISILQRKIQM